MKGTAACSVSTPYYFMEAALVMAGVAGSVGDVDVFDHLLDL